jgi:hypothetical protein
MVGMPLRESLKSVARTHKMPLKDELDKLNAEIRRSGTAGTKECVINFFAVARHLLYFVLDASEPDSLGDADVAPTDGSVNSRYNWNAALTAYNAFAADVGDGFFEQIGDWHHIRNFCEFRTRRRGTTSRRFYVGLAAFVVDLADNNRLLGALFNAACPHDELNLPDTIKNAFEGIFRDVGQPRAARKTRVINGDTATEGDHRVTLEFCCRSVDQEEMAKFVTRFASTDGQTAHFVLYRARRSDPLRLMKSLLTISEAPDPHATHHAYFQFRHVYMPPESIQGGTIRESLGIALPLEHGVYLVGGNVEPGSSQPTGAMSVLALPWLEIKRRDTLLHALDLGTNYGNKHLVAETAVRPTPLHDAGELRLGDLHVDALLGDLQKDLLVEKAIFGDEGHQKHFAPENFPLWEKDGEGHRARSCAVSILKMTNGPSRKGSWDIKPGYARGNEFLTAPKLVTHVERLLTNRTGKNFRRKVEGIDEEFAFWTSIRFGPLTHDS